MNGKPKIQQLPNLTDASATDQRSVARSSVLLTAEELAERLSVPPSWVREKTRVRSSLRDKDPLPVVRLGKYCRFKWSEIQAWLERQKQ